MKLLFVIFLFISGSAFGQVISKPGDLRQDKILVYLNDYNESLLLLNDEFDRSTSDDQKSERKKALEDVGYFKRAMHQDDRWALGVDPKLFSWINESLAKILKKSKTIDYIPVAKNTIGNYRIEEFKYVLKFGYILVNGDISDARMFFYIHDRESGEDNINYNDPLKDNSFRPFVYTTGTNITGTELYPYYIFLRLFNVKKEWASFFKNI